MAIGKNDKHTTAAPAPAPAAPDAVEERIARLEATVKLLCRAQIEAGHYGGVRRDAPYLRALEKFLESP